MLFKTAYEDLEVEPHVPNQLERHNQVQAGSKIIKKLKLIL